MRVGNTVHTVFGLASLGMPKNQLPMNPANHETRCTQTTRHPSFKTAVIQVKMSLPLTFAVTFTSFVTSEDERLNKSRCWQLCTIATVMVDVAATVMGDVAFISPNPTTCSF